MAKRFPFDLPVITVPDDDFDSYASFQEDIWNTEGPGTWWDWWTKGRDPRLVAKADDAIEALVGRGVERVELLGEIRDLASAALAYGITRRGLTKHLEVIDAAREDVGSILGTGLALDAQVTAAGRALMMATERWLTVCRPHEKTLHRTRHAYRDEAIRRFQQYVVRATGSSRLNLIAPIVSVCAGTHFTDAQLRMLRKRVIEKKARR